MQNAVFPQLCHLLPQKQFTRCKKNCYFVMLLKNKLTRMPTKRKIILSAAIIAFLLKKPLCCWRNCCGVIWSLSWWRYEAGLSPQHSLLAWRLDALLFHPLPPGARLLSVQQLPLQAVGDKVVLVDLSSLWILQMDHILIFKIQLK